MFRYRSSVVASYCVIHSTRNNFYMKIYAARSPVEQKCEGGIWLESERRTANSKLKKAGNYHGSGERHWRGSRRSVGEPGFRSDSGGSG